ncbi:response regulator [uncultured Desulfobacter sp.]|uniref:response regulator n=1 Tax=uncultured Desulfobacter sp. TaxID=240139 RepID=UPI002AAAC2F2|nr:response regulator [uncultured Desulfobacter sp.]
MQILLVDDEKELVSTLAERLGYRGIDAHWAVTPSDAIAMLSKQSYDIAVLDVQMPEMNGFELKEKMEALSSELKFIFMTGHGSEECYHEGCSQTGEAFYLVKPVDIDSLIEKLNQVMLNGGKS